MNGKEREMPEVDDDDLDLDDPENQDPTESNAVRQQRAQIKRLEKEAREGAAAKRELAFVRAGVKLDDPLGALFAKGYDGEITPEAIKAAWETIVPASTTPPATQEVPDPQAAAEPPAPETLSRERQELATGAAPADARTGSARQDILQESEALLKEGTFGDAVSHYVNRLANGVNSGDIAPLPNNGYLSRQQ